VWLSFVKRLVIGLFCGERLTIIADFHANMHFTHLKGLGVRQILFDCFNAVFILEMMVNYLLTCYL
jgi:hypothetical protein